MLRSTPRTPRRTTALIAAGALALSGVAASCDDDDDDLQIDDELEQDVEDLEDDVEDGVDDAEQEIEDGVDDAEQEIDEEVEHGRAGGQVDPDVTEPGRPELGSRAQLDTPLAERVRRVVAEAQSPAVDPGEVRRRGRGVARARQMPFEQVDQRPAVLVEHRDHRVEPVVAVVPCSDGGRHRQDVRCAEVVAGQGCQRSPQRLVADVHHGPSQPGQVERLRGRRHRDGTGGHLAPERLERDVAVARHDQVGVDLVGHDDEVVLGGQLGDALQLGTVEDVTERVVRVTEDPDPGPAGRQLGIEPVVVERTAVGIVVHRYEPAVHVVDRGEERVVCR